MNISLLCAYLHLSFNFDVLESLIVIILYSIIKKKQVKVIKVGKYDE